MWYLDRRLVRIHASRFGSFDNFCVRVLLGSKCIGDNQPLVSLLRSEFSKSGSILALHGLHHYRYDVMSEERVFAELSAGKELLEKLLESKPSVFIHPFNCWNEKTEAVCKSLDLSVDKCMVSFDKRSQRMTDDQIVQFAKDQSSIAEVHYHPYRILSLDKFELYLRNRRKFLST